MAETPATTKKDPNAMIKPGDVLINKVELTTLGGGLLDLKPFIVEINVYEDMFSPSLNGNIIIRDAMNLIGKLPIVGDEILTLDIQTPGFGEPGKYDNINKIQKSFSVYSVKDRKLNNDREQFYAISFCSLEASLDNVTRVSQKFSGSTDEIASEVFETFMKVPRFFKSKIIDYNEGEHSEFVISDTPHESHITFVSPMWTPMQIMNWLAKRSIGNKYKTPNYLFYETTKGFYFTSIEENIAVQMENKLIYSDYIYNTPLTDTTTESSVNMGYATVEAVKFLTNLDVLQSQDLGHFASSVFKFDMIKKEHELYIYDHGFNFKGTEENPAVHMESYKEEGGNNVRDETKKYNMIFPATVMRSYNSKTFMNTVNPGVLDSTEDSVDLHPELFVGQRNSSLLDISTLKMLITVPGRTDCEAGKLIRFFYPSVSEKNEEVIKDAGGLWDPLVSGIFMISAIHHHITPFHHNMYMEIVKDSYANELLDVTETESTGDSSKPADDSSSTPSTPTQTSGSPTNTGTTVTNGYSFLGDSIAVRVGGAAKGEKSVNATVGYSTSQILSSYAGKAGKTATVISAGTNDWGTGSWAQTEKNLKAIRDSIKAGKVVWIVPNTNLVAGKNDKQINGMKKAAELVRKIAGSEPKIELSQYKCSDGLHPDTAELAKILSKITSIVGK